MLKEYYEQATQGENQQQETHGENKQQDQTNRAFLDKASVINEVIPPDTNGKVSYNHGRPY